MSTDEGGRSLASICHCTHWANDQATLQSALDHTGALMNGTLSFDQNAIKAANDWNAVGTAFRFTVNVVQQINEPCGPAGPAHACPNTGPVGDNPIGDHARNSYSHSPKEGQATSPRRKVDRVGGRVIWLAAICWAGSDALPHAGDEWEAAPSSSTSTEVLMIPWRRFGHGNSNVAVRVPPPPAQGDKQLCGILVALSLSARVSQSGLLVGAFGVQQQQQV
jgi:hypothetical protein